MATKTAAIPLGTNLPPLKERPMWTMWRDFFTSTRTWRMKTPIGVMQFKTKKQAVISRAIYENSRAARLAREAAAGGR